MDINQVIPSDEHMLTSQSIHENIFTTSITSSISTNRLLDNSLTSSNFHTEPIKIKEESQVDFPDNDDDDNNNNIIDNSNNYITTTQHTNNFLNNQISEQYHEQNENHLSGNELQSNLTRLTTIDYLKRHPCTYRGCNKVFFSRTSLIYHKQSHSIDKPYICKYTDCGITFSNETLLKTHNQLHESKQLRERFSCSLSECNKVFVTRESLIEHIHKNQRRQYHCIHPGCCKTFLYSRSLTEHMNVHLGERPYVCDYSGCEKSFTRGGSGGGSGVDKSTNSMCSQSSISRQYDSVTVTIPVLQPMHYPFNQSIIPNKQQQQQHQQTQLQQHPVLSNTNMNMTNHLPAHLFYPNQHN
ncbi:unnamed protein product [Heterobilharzia americana]|nr:unnamed protein product [Heterobilharzia americana]